MEVEARDFRWSHSVDFGPPQSQGEYPQSPQRTQPFMWRRRAPHSGQRDAAAGEVLSLRTVSEERSRMVCKHHRITMAGGR